MMMAMMMATATTTIINMGKVVLLDIFVMELVERYDIMNITPYYYYHPSSHNFHHMIAFKEVYIWGLWE